MENKRILLLLPVVASSVLFGCAKSASSSTASAAPSCYPIAENSSVHQLTVTKDNTFKTTYDNNTLIDFTGISVSFDGQILASGSYFFVSDKSNPADTIIDSTNYYLYSNIPSSTYSYYAAYNDSSSQYLYVSDPITVTINNKSAVSPWLVYVGMAIFVVAIGAWTFIRSKAKKEGRA